MSSLRGQAPLERLEERNAIAWFLERMVEDAPSFGSFSLRNKWASHCAASAGYRGGGVMVFFG